MDLRIGYALTRWFAPELTTLGFINFTNVTVTNDIASSILQSPFYGPARTENYTFFRYGWFAGLGGRATTPTTPVQGCFGLTFGVAATTAQFTKLATTQGNSNANAAEVVLPDEKNRTSPSQTLFNPAIAMDASAAIDFGSGVKAYVGGLMLATFSDRSILLAGEYSSLGVNAASGARTPYGMPNVTASHKTSIYIGPTFGFHIGH